MSYDLGVWAVDRRWTDQEARDTYSRLCDGDLILSGHSPAVDEFYGALTKRYPEIDTLTDDEVDTCPWASGLDRSPMHVIMTVVWSRAAEIDTFAVALAAAHRLLCYDPQSGTIRTQPSTEVRTERGPREAGFTLQEEGRAPVAVTRWEDIAPRLARLHPSGPSFIVLDHPSGAFMQAAGGKDALTLEFRTADSGDGVGQHYRLGKEPEQDGEAHVDTKEGRVYVRTHEVLTYDDAYRAFRSFFQTGEPPAGFTLRPLDETYR